MNDNKDRNKRIIISVISLILLVIIVIGITYAAFSYSKKGKIINTITTGKVTMTYMEAENGISITDAMPMSDNDGKVLSAGNQKFDFIVSAQINGNRGVAYEVTGEKITTANVTDSEGNTIETTPSTLGNNDVRIYLEKSSDGNNYRAVTEPSNYVPLEETDSFGAAVGEMVLDTDTINSSNVTYYYRLRMWGSEDYILEDEEKVFSLRVNVYGNNGFRVESDKTPNPPVLNGDMIPVSYDETNKKWIKASTTSGWYDYSNQKWANAVTVSSTSRTGYKTAAVGTEVKMTDINTMWVWIPRYSYTLGNTYGYQIEGASTPSLETPGAFDIKFVDKDTTELGSGNYSGTDRSNSSNRELSGIMEYMIQ